MSGHVTATEAALQAHISRERLLRKVQQGEIAGELIGGRWMILRSSLERFLQQQTAGEVVQAGASR